MKFEDSIDCIWTDGGNPSSPGYFDGAKDLNRLLQCMFDSDDNRLNSDRYPIQAAVMGSVEHGTKVKITVKVETIG